ncbi:MAG: hypothetical protein PF447_04195 [Spirochaetaceae bacterium]|jgi:hypothetical protein|nr:hypothetical protein [Spirochaetaceae bacterium]
MEHRKKVIIGGFAGSGSSAVVDLLSEVEGHYTLGREFRLTNDPDGIIDLEHSLLDSWSPYKSDMALKRFDSFITRLGTKNKYPYINQNFTKTFTKDFIRLSKEYINNLKAFSYCGIWVGINNPYTRFLKKLYKYIKFPIEKRLPQIHIAYPEEDFFYITRDYLESLIKASS